MAPPHPRENGGQREREAAFTTFAATKAPRGLLDRGVAHGPVAR